MKLLWAASTVSFRKMAGIAGGGRDGAGGSYSDGPVSMEKKKRLNYIHTFRGIAIVFIVAGHCIDLFDWKQNVFAERLLRSFMMNGSVLFVFIAGFLFQHLSYKFQYQEYIKKKITNVIIPYLIISIPVIVYYLFVTKASGLFPESMRENNLAYKAVWLYLTGHQLFSYWFIPMISIFYLIAPVLVALDRKEYVYWTLPFFLLISIFIHRSIDNLNIIHNFIFFFSAYFTGMWFSRYKERVIPLMQKRLPLLFIVLVGLIAVEVLFCKQVGNIHVAKMFSSDKGLIDINFIQKVILCSFFVGLLSKYDHMHSKTLSVLANTSFSIYFIHTYVLFVMFRSMGKFDINIAGTVWYQLLSIALILVACMFVIKMMNGIFGKNSRYIIGVN